MNNNRNNGIPENGGERVVPRSSEARGEEKVDPATPPRASVPRRAAMNNPFSLESAAEAARAEKEDARHIPMQGTGNTPPQGSNASTNPPPGSKESPRDGISRTPSRNPGESSEEWAKRVVAQYIREIDELDALISISPELRAGKNLESIAFIMGRKDMGNSTSYEETVNKVRYAAKIARRRREDLDRGANTRRRLEDNQGRLYTTAERDRFSQGQR